MPIVLSVDGYSANGFQKVVTKIVHQLHQVAAHQLVANTKFQQLMLMLDQPVHQAVTAPAAYTDNQLVQVMDQLLIQNQHQFAVLATT